MSPLSPLNGGRPADRRRDTDGRLATRAVRAALDSDPQHRAVVPPLHLSANFAFDAPGVCGRFDYTRSGNPTRQHLADALADLEGGAGAVVTATGMAAVTVVAQLVSPGDVVVAPHDCYGGTQRLFKALSRRLGFTVLWLDQTLPSSAEAARARRPRLVWVETPSNPLLRVVDIAAWADVAHAAGGLCVVDNTFLSPAYQQPLALGADAVVHSTTKFINGHSDVVGGAVIARDADLAEELGWWANCLGVTGAPFDAWLTLRGLRTLNARLRVHEANALALVDVALRHPAAIRVHHPSLPTTSGHDIARRQQTGWGSLVTLEVAGGREGAEAFVSGLRHFTLAESLGGVESLVAHPATMTHASMEEDARREAGIHDGVLRLSVGIEAEEDLAADLTRALDRVEVAACARV
jgi:cystathionine gamma-synthase